MKQDYDKHLAVTIIVLVVLPILLGYFFFILSNPSYRDQVITFFMNILGSEGLEWAFNFFESIYLLTYIIMPVTLIFYPIYPYIFSLEKHFHKRNPISALAEYRGLKKAVYIMLPAVLFTLVLLIYSRIIPGNPLTALVLSLDEVQQSFIFSILSALFFVGMSALFRLVILNINKRFKFYLAKLSFGAMSKVEDNAESIRYLIEGLIYYDKYIRRTFGLEINELKVICSKIIADPSVNKNSLMKELYEAFEDKDKLKPIRHLIGFLNVKDTERFLVNETAGKKVEDWVGILATLATIITTVTSAVVALSQLEPPEHPAEDSIIEENLRTQQAQSDSATPAAWTEELLSEPLL